MIFNSDSINIDLKDFVEFSRSLKDYKNKGVLNIFVNFDKQVFKP